MSGSLEITDFKEKENVGPSIPPAARDVLQYDEGRKAFDDGQDIDDCPYPPKNFSMYRIAWLTGWLDGRRWQRLGHLYEKHGWNFPDE